MRSALAHQRRPGSPPATTLAAEPGTLRNSIQA